MANTNDPRFWVIDSIIESDDPSLPHPDSVQGGTGPHIIPIVDEEYGGVIAWANTPEQADRIVRGLELATAQTDRVVREPWIITVFNRLNKGQA